MNVDNDKTRQARQTSETNQAHQIRQTSETRQTRQAYQAIQARQATPENPASPFSLTSWEGRAIALVDLDAFFASVEQHDHPEWKGKPVVVGGRADAHGVVSTCSYEARAYGIKSAMPASTAKRLCPHAIFTSPRMSRYSEVSKQVMELLLKETPHVEQVSIDEAFLDISPTKVNREHPALIAERIQARVKNLGITCSIGLASSKAVAKVASNMDKPRGLTIIYPGREREFLAPLPVRALSGVGQKTEMLLLRKGIKTLDDLANASEGMLVRILGKNGAVLRARARGEDASKISIKQAPKSISHEVTFSKSLTEEADVKAALLSLSTKVCRRARAHNICGKTIVLRVRYADRTYKTIQRQLDEPCADEFLIMRQLETMIGEFMCPGAAISLLGVGLGGLFTSAHVQMNLFCDDEKDTYQRKNLISATDKVKNRFGESAVRFGSELRIENNNTR